MVAGVEVSREKIRSHHVHTIVTQQISTTTPRHSRPIHTARPTASLGKAARLRRDDRHGRRLPARYDPSLRSVDRQWRRPLRRFRARSGRRPGLRSHAAANNTGEGASRSVQLERRRRLQADPDIAASMRPTAPPKAPSAASWTRPAREYNGLELDARQRQAPGGAGSRGRHQVGAVRQALARNRRPVPDRRRQCSHERQRRQRHAPIPRRASPASTACSGIELGVAGNITEDWSVFGGLVLLDTEVLGFSRPRRTSGDGWPTSRSRSSRCCRKYQLTDQLAVGGTATYGERGLRRPLRRQRYATTTRCDWWRFDAFAEYEIIEELGDRAARASTSRTSSITMPSIRRPNNGTSPSSRRAAPAT